MINDDLRAGILTVADIDAEELDLATTCVWCHGKFESLDELDDVCTDVEFGQCVESERVCIACLDKAGANDAETTAYEFSFSD
jgi:hypothetical protein